MCFRNLYAFTYVMEDNLKLEILKIHPQLHLLFQCSPQCQIIVHFFFFCQMFALLNKRRCGWRGGMAILTVQAQ